MDKNIPKEKKGFNKLPEDVQKKIDPKLAAEYRRGGKVKKNTRRMNQLEELGRVDAEKAYTRKGKRNLKDEKARIVSELKNGGKILKKVPDKAKGLKKLPKQVRNKMGFHKSGGRVGMGVALRGGGRVR